MPPVRPDEVWQRLVAHAGERFTQLRGGTFTYDARGTALHLDRTNQAIPRQHIDEALSLVPLANTVPLQHLRAPSYIYALLMDPRIRQEDW